MCVPNHRTASSTLTLNEGIAETTQEEDKSRNANKKCILAAARYCPTVVCYLAALCIIYIRLGLLPEKQWLDMHELTVLPNGRVLSVVLGTSSRLANQYPLQTVPVRANNVSYCTCMPLHPLRELCKQVLSSCQKQLGIPPVKIATGTI